MNKTTKLRYPIFIYYINNNNFIYLAFQLEEVQILNPPLRQSHTSRDNKCSKKIKRKMLDGIQFLTLLLCLDYLRGEHIN